MSVVQEIIIRAYHGLKTLLADSFPKACTGCDRTYGDLDAFLVETVTPHGSTAFTERTDSDNRPVLELARNCACGARLTELFHDRRDQSSTGHQSRQAFGKLLDILDVAGQESIEARQELLEALHCG